MDAPQSEVVVFRTRGYAVLILARPRASSAWYLLSVSTFTGSLSFDGFQNSSIFDSFEAATAFINEHHDVTDQEQVKGHALVGLARYGPVVYILLVTEAAPVARIQNRHVVYAVKGVSWVVIDLPFHGHLSTKASRRIQRIKEFPLANLHFWCETRDLTNPTFVKRERKESFVWNGFWRKPFEELGLGGLCIELLQGSVSSEVMELESQVLKMTIVTIREAAHGGTRYNARGLDSDGFAGNEVQSEIIIESNSGRLWSYCMRRGTVPVKWKSICSRAMPTVSIMVETDFAKMTPVYFDALKKDFHGAIKCLNLLHCQQGNSEMTLCTAYSEAVSVFEGVEYKEFDWHGSVKENGIGATVEALFEMVGTPVISYSETVPGLPTAPVECGSKVFGNEDELPETGVEFSVVQDSVLRVNCMDSLDRTNTACFYYSCLVTSIVLDELGIGKMINTYQELMEMPLDVRRFLANAFISIGDSIAAIYTNTQACMTETFYTVGEKESKSPSDGQIAVQRRFHNFVTDKKRQKDITLFLGKSFHEMLPEVNCGFLPKLVSGPPAVMMPPMVYTGQKLVDATALLQFSSKTLKFISATSLIVLLNEYTYVSHIVIVVAPPCPPCSVKISTSLTYGPKIPLVSRVAIPQVKELTPVVIRVPPDYANFSSFLSRFVYIEFESDLPEVTISNIFIYGDKKEPFSLFSESYQNINDHQLDDLEFKGADTTPPEIVVRGIKKVDYFAVIRLEISRLFHKMSRLACMAKLPMWGLDPMDFNLRHHRLSLIPTGVQVVGAEKCCMCSNESRWKCFKCQRAFCGEGCSQQHNIGETFYFEFPAMICNDCFTEYADIVEHVNTLLRLFRCFYKLYDPQEDITHQWLLSHLNTHTTRDPTRFPCAFFTTADNPTYNLVLTDSGGAIKAPQNLGLALGTAMAITSIAIECSDDCSVVIRPEGSMTKCELNALTSRTAACSFSTQFLTLTLRQGTLHKLSFTATPLPKPNFDLTQPITTADDPKEIRTRVTNNSQRHSALLDAGRPMPIKGISFQSLSAVRSLILVFYATDTRETPIATDHYYIPECDSPFVLRFKHEVTARLVQVQYYDIIPGFTEPKITMFVNA